MVNKIRGETYMVWILNKEYVSRGYMFLSIYAYIRSAKSVNR